MVEGEQPRHSGSEGAEGALKGPHVCSQLWGSRTPVKGRAVEGRSGPGLGGECSPAWG